MAYVLRSSEPVETEVPHVARAELEAAVVHLTHFPKGVDRGVHEARKHFKKLRALMRLVRKDLGKSFGPQNHRLRDVARELSAARDQTVLRKLILGLAAELPDDLAAALLERLPAEPAHGAPVATARLLEELRHAEDDVARWQVTTGGVEHGWRRAYRRGRKALAQVRKHGSDMEFHEWRKRVKDHWYHMRLLRELSPAADARRVDLHRLSELLGDANDFAVLESRLGRELIGMFKQGVPPTDAFARLNEHVADRKRRLWADALELGAVLYAEKPDALGIVIA